MLLSKVFRNENFNAVVAFYLDLFKNTFHKFKQLLPNHLIDPLTDNSRVYIKF